MNKARIPYTISLLTVENLSHTFSNRTLLKDVSFRLLAEDHAGLVGANGVGKSTLHKTMLGKINPLSGTVERGDFLFPSYFEQEVKTDNITPIDDVWNAFPG